MDAGPGVILQPVSATLHLPSLMPFWGRQRSQNKRVTETASKTSMNLRQAFTRWKALRDLTGLKSNIQLDYFH